MADSITSRSMRDFLVGRLQKHSYWDGNAGAWTDLSCALRCVSNYVVATEDLTLGTPMETSKESREIYTIYDT